MNPNEATQSTCRTATPEKPRGRSGCLWLTGILGVFVILCLLAVTALIAGAVFSIYSDSGSGDSLKSYDREYISGTRGSKNIILTVPVSGIIHSGDMAGAFSQEGASADKICKQLNAALRDSNVKAVIIKIDSPGGEVVAADRIYNAVQKIRKAKIPVIAVMESLAASGGLYIAVGCDKIVANPMTTTGSIGVIIQTYKYYDLFKKIGLESESYTSGPYKALLDGSRPTTQTERLIIQKQVDEVYEHFVGVVAAGRPKLTADKIKHSTIGDGRIMLGKDALQAGLVDQLGYFQDGVDVARKAAKLPENDYMVMCYSRRFSLFSLLGAQANAASRNINIKLPGSGSTNLKAGRFYFLPAN
ncbi:signal peptide peptidase SppA [Lentisphaerota bacterium ZTH]|nr:signal peptide peptidase SppA [Lentisphaerota bacterium]WET07661.1 signal peptide peptidase SppA [Lentisphaerota bacterium ZTH]